MTNLDTANRETMELCNGVAQALSENNEEKAAQAFAKYAESIEKKALAYAQQYRDEKDISVLEKRGCRMLTAEEKTYYEGIKAALKSGDIRQSMTTTNMRLPETVVNDVFTGIAKKHPLLENIDFTDTSVLTTWDVNVQGAQKAVWGDLTDEITKELNGNVNIVSVQLKKLSAYFPISVAWLDLGPEWLDRYIRAILTESIALGVEDSAINGNGLKQPIGMIKDIEGDIDQSTGYPDKDAIIVERFDSATYGALVADLAEDGNGEYRDAENLILIVNPVDYYTLVMPATQRQLTDGAYINDILPVPTKIIRSSAVTKGTAVLGLGGNYWFGVGVGTNGGKIEYSDEYKWLEDMRYYKVKLYGNGRPIDNNSFTVLDISGLLPYAQLVALDDATIDAITPEITPVMSLLTVTSAAGTASGKTAITVTEEKVDDDDVYKYKVSTTAVSIPVVGTRLGNGYTSWDGSAEITAATDSYIVIVEIDGDNIVKAVGYTTVTAAV